MDEELFTLVLQDWFRGLDHEFGPQETETTVSILPALAEMSSPVFDWNQLLTGSATEAALPAGGGRVIEDESKKSENGTKKMEEDNETEERFMENGSDGSFFDCAICLDLSKEPVVTNCGHLYCWSCLYQWLKLSVAKQCPVCKGKISVETLTPIYGSGKSQEVSHTDKNIPSRPKAKRIESQRNVHQRPAHIQERIEREFSTEDRRTRFLNRFRFSRGVRAEQNQSSASLVAPVDDRRTSSQLRARWFPTENVIVNQMENNLPSVGLEDRGSFSSIVGVTNSEYQVDTADEIVSMFTYANGSRVSDVDSADSQPLWSRR